MPKKAESEPEYGKNFYGEDAELSDEYLEKSKEQPPQAKEFNLNAALDNEEFVTFLGTYEDAEALEERNVKEVKTRFEAFENKNELGKGLTELYADEIRENLGVELTPDAQEKLREFLASEAREHPEKLRTRLEEFRHYTGLKKQVGEYDAVIKELGGEENLETAVSELEGQAGAIRKAQRIEDSYKGFHSYLRKAGNFLGSKKGLAITVGAAAGGLLFSAPALAAIAAAPFAVGAYEAARRWGILGKEQKKTAAQEARIGKMTEARRKRFFEQADKDLKAVNRKLGVLQGTERVKEGRKLMGELRVNLFKEFEGGKDVYRIALAHAWDQVNRFTDQGTNPDELKRLEDAQTLFEKFESFKAAKFGGEEPDIENFTEEKAETLREKLNTNIESTVATLVAKNIHDFKPGGAAFTEIEGKLRPYFSKERIGGKKTAEAREFIVETLKGQIEELAKRLERVTADVEEKRKKREGLDTELKTEREKLKTGITDPKKRETAENRVKSLEFERKTKEKEVAPLVKEQGALRAKRLLLKGLIVKLHA